MAPHLDKYFDGLPEEEWSPCLSVRYWDASADRLYTYTGGYSAPEGCERIFSPAGVELMLREATGGRFSKTPVAWLRSDTDPFGCFGELQSPSCIGHPGFSGCMLTVDPRDRRIGVILSNSPRLPGDWSRYGRMWNKLAAL